MRLNKKGFTLVELLAAMVILAVIMVIAVPNIMGILTNSRANTYVEDAKKLLSLAEYQFRGHPELRPAKNACIVMTLKYLDNSELKNAPNNGEYDQTNSYVLVVNKPESGKNKYVYYVTLDEKLDNGTHRGIASKSYDQLYGEEASDLVVIGSGTNVLATASSITGSVGCSSGITKTY